jgi:glucose-1-phosphate thymidylyltransferase
MNERSTIRGVVLAGGTGSRMAPLTLATNKHLLPVGETPMVLHGIAHLRDAGIDDILVVTSPEAVGDFARLLGSGHRWGVRITLRVQDQPGGIAQALGLARGFAARERVCVLLGDNLFADPLRPQVDAWLASGRGARVLLKQVPDPGRYGVARVEGDRIAEILEKPADPPSDLAVTGIYFYDGRVYDIAERQKPSGRGEYEITDVNNAYIAAGELSWGLLPGWWTDAGTLESYALANRLIRGEVG